MQLRFMKYRKLSYWISGILVALSIVSLSVRGLNYGIDFAGGISMEVIPITADYTIDKMRHDLAEFKPELQAIASGDSVVDGISMTVIPTSADYTIDGIQKDLAKFKPELKSVGDKSILVRVESPKGATEFQEEETIRQIKNVLGARVKYSDVQIIKQKTDGVLIRVGLPKGTTDAQQNERVSQIKDILGDRVKYSQVQIVGPKIGGELVRGGIWAILVSFILMSIYIWIRYRGGYAVGSFVSLILDFVLMFGFFSAVGLEFNQTAIAVILMGIGYSINDKVVNYDRIDENIKKYHKMPMDDLIDLSVNEMLSRTLMTSISTILALLGLFVFGGIALRDFAIAMTFSVVMGTLTSIYISNVILYHFNLRDTKY